MGKEEWLSRLGLPGGRWTEDEHRIRACAGKLQFKTKRRAEINANGQRVRMRVYRCRFCGLWHRTSQIKPPAG
jgi:hypothetical protein